MPQTAKPLSLLNIILLAILSGVLMGLSYSPIAPFITAFVAIIPLLRIAKQHSLLESAMAAFGAAIITVLLADWGLWTRYGVLHASGILVLQAFFISLPWVSFHIIHHRHNPKLGIWALVSSWLVIEWASSQFLGFWQGLQLGYAFISLPILVQWYSILGVTGGSLWALAVNSQFYRYFFPEKNNDRAAALINLAIFILLPLVLSVSMHLFYHLSINKTPNVALIETSDLGVKMKEARSILINGDSSQLEQFEGGEVLFAQGQRPFGWQYQMTADTVQSAYHYKNEQLYPIYSKSLQTSGIAGIQIVNVHLVQWGDNLIRTGLVNQQSLARADLIRLYKTQAINQIIAFAPLQTGLFHFFTNLQKKRLAQARALENRVQLLVVSPEKQSFCISSNGSVQPLVWKDGIAQTKLEWSHNSFYTKYGDLLGRLSIFLIIWLLLATVVKPYRETN